MSKLMFIENEWVKSSNDKQLDVFDPSQGKVMETVPYATKDDVERAVDAAHDALQKGIWSKIPPGDRANLLLKVASMLEAKADEFAKLESANSGKSIKQCMGYDIPYTVDNMRFIAGARILEGKAMGEYVTEGTSAIRREPIGVVGVITPWNYPLMMVVWRPFPALAMGNTVVIKPATYTPLTTIELAKVMQEAGLPKGVLNVVTGPGGVWDRWSPPHTGIMLRSTSRKASMKEEDCSWVERDPVYRATRRVTTYSQP